MSNWIVVDAVGRQYLSYGNFLSKQECQVVCNQLNNRHPKFRFRPFSESEE